MAEKLMQFAVSIGSKFFALNWDVKLIAFCFAKLFLKKLYDFCALQGSFYSLNIVLIEKLHGAIKFSR